MTTRDSEPFVDEASGEVSVRGYLHRAATEPRGVLVLTHGAGGNCSSPFLVAVADALTGFGLAVLRCDLPFRQARPKGSPSPSNATRDQEGLRRAVLLMQKRLGPKVYLGGQSYGGRQASMLAASDPELVNALLLLSYPLHPPGRPDRMRTAHFPNLRTPVLFAHGDSDPFATSTEIATAVNLIPARTRIVEVTGAGHSLLTKRNRDEPPKTIADAFAAFVS